MFISSLPTELQYKILVNLDGLSLARAECVCKIWREILTELPFNLIWRRECLHNIDSSVLIELTGIEDILVSELKCSDSQKDTRVWKAAYKKWHTCKKVGQWPVIISETKSSEAAVNHILVSGDIIFTAHGHEDHRIKIWDSWTGECLQTLSGHHKTITCIALYHKPVNTLEPRIPELLASASDDAEVRIWKVETGSCQAIYRENTGPVNCLAISKEHVISASSDGDIHKWDILKNTLCMKIKRAHCYPILYLSAWKSTAVSVARDKIKFWSLKTCELLQCVKNNELRTSLTVGCILRSGHAIFMKSSGEFIFWDFNGFNSVEAKPTSRYDLLTFRETQASYISCFATYGNLLAVGTQAGMVFVFYYNTDWSEQLTKVHYQVNTDCLDLCCLALSHDGDGPLLITGNKHGLVKIYRWFSPSIE